jgi:hypothetical protein
VDGLPTVIVDPDCEDIQIMFLGGAHLLEAVYDCVDRNRALPKGEKNVQIDLVERIGFGPITLIAWNSPKDVDDHYVSTLNDLNKLIAGQVSHVQYLARMPEFKAAWEMEWKDTHQYMFPMHTACLVIHETLQML